MFFKRSNGEFRETDRVTRFKLIKSGKNWLRASTSNFGLLKVIRGQVEETIVAEVREDAASVKGLTSRGFIKGIVVATAVLGATTLVNTGHADEQGKDAVPTSALVSSAEVATGSESLSEQDSKESPVVGNESATEAKVTAATSTEVAEDVPAADDKAVLEQNASEAALLTKIADKYASNHQNSEQKAAISDAVAKVQSELSAGTNLTEATAQSYTDQRARLSKSVDDMMATLKAAGFEGNTTVNGAPAVYAQLAPISTEGNGSVATSPVISEPNGATIEDAAFNKAGYSLDPNADRYTFGVWQFLKTDQSTGKKTYFDYYATLSVDRSAIKGDLSVKPDVYLRIIKKSDGSEAFTRTIKAGESNISLPGYITDNNTDVTNTLTYTGANGTDPGNVTFSFVNPNLEYETLQIRDTNFPGNENEDKPNIQTSVPYATVNQTTHYKVVDSSKYTEGKLYTPTGNETDLASYTHTGLAGQQFTASNNRDIPGYKHVAATTDSTQKTSGILGKGVVGQKLVELQGGANHYYVKRISEIVDTEGSTVTKFYALDPSQVNNFTTSDIGTEDVSKYTLIYTSKVNKAGEEWKADETKVTKVNSKNGDYYLEVNETAGSKSLIITGWSSPTETDTYKQMDGTLHTYPRPFKGAPNPTLTPAGSGNNSYNVIAGKVPEIQAEGSVANDPTAPNGKVYTKLKGYASFSNNYSIPSNLKPSTDVNYYFVKSDVKGNVYVHYKDTEGKTIKPDVTDEKDQPVNKAYDTVVDNRPKEITFEGKTYELVPAGNYTVGEVDEQGHLKSSDPTTGVVAKEDKNVTYIYKLKEGEVVITYVDEKGKEIQKPRQDTPNSPYDTPYNTTEEGEKPNTIKSEDGKTYKIVPKGEYPVGKVDENGHLESSDPVTGKVTKPKSTITYVYKEVNGNVYVHYVDTEGKTIKEDVIDEKAQPVDKDYDTVKDNRPQEIEFEGNTYELVPAGNYTVGEVDDQGHLTSSDDTTGKVIEGDKNVTYVYKLKETPDKPVEPTPDKPVEPTPDKPVEPTPDKPVEPTPDKPVEPTPDKPVEPTPDKPVEPTPDKPVEPTPDKPVEPTPDKPVEPTPDKPVEPTPDKPVEPTPDKPVEPTPDKPVEPTPDKPVDPTPGKPVDPTPGKPVNPTPGKPVNPTPGKPVDPTPGKPVNPTPGKPVDPTPGKPVNPTPGKPVNPTPGKPVDPTPGKPVNPTPGKPVDPTPGKPVNPTSAKGQLPNTGETTSAGSTVLGVVAGLVGLAALGRRKKEDEK